MSAGGKGTDIAWLHKTPITTSSDFFFAIQETDITNAISLEEGTSRVKVVSDIPCIARAKTARVRVAMAGCHGCIRAPWLKLVVSSGANLGRFVCSVYLADARNGWRGIRREHR
jgi:hypothetical protein